MSAVLKEIANENLETRLKDNPCRGIVVGMLPDEALCQFAWIMGRSENSQNRIYVVDDADRILKTAPFDASKVADPRLIIYNVMRSVGNAHIVSNGDQTDTVHDNFSGANNASFNVSTAPADFYESLSRRHCEPDAPTFTPRITAYAIESERNAYFSVLRAEPEKKAYWIETVEKMAAEGRTSNTFRNMDAFKDAVGKRAGLEHMAFPSIHDSFDMPLAPGFGYCVTTYKPGSKELPSFDGEPFLVPLVGPLVDSMMHLWAHLDGRWRVAIAGKEIRGDYFRMAAFNSKEEM